MNTVFLCLCPWKEVIDSIPCLCWGVIGLIALYLLLKYLAQPFVNNRLELDAKEKAFEREKFWAKADELKASTDDALKNKIEELQNKVKELEKEKDAKDALEKQLSIYKKIMDELNIEVKPKEKNK